MEQFLSASHLVFNVQTLTTILVASAFGLFVGAIPGLSATMAIALLVPFTFYMDPVPAIAAIVTCSAMAITAGDIPSALLRIPGTPASAAYTDEAYAMARTGKGGLAITISLVSSCIGGLFGFAVLMFSAPYLSKLGLSFSSFEYFWLTALGLSCAVLINASRLTKALIGLFIGLLLAAVGTDPLTGTARLTFGSTALLGGISFIPAMIGLFAIPEILRNVRPSKATTIVPVERNPWAGLGRILWKYRQGLCRGSVLGTVVGALPGAGGDIAAWMSYTMSKRFSSEPEKFGSGHPEGLVEAGASNNSALSASWIPAMVFGIPGDTITAIAIGVLYMKGMNPGPQLFTTHAENYYAVMIIFVIANILMVPFGYLALMLARQIFRVPRPMLQSVILVFCILGAYSINNAVSDIFIMIAIGILAVWLEANRVPMAPIILGLVLGPLLEQNFLTSLSITGGGLLGFVERPISVGIAIVTLAMWSVGIVSSLRSRDDPYEAATRNIGNEAR